MLSCQAGLINCRGICTDTDFDLGNCGGCDDGSGSNTCPEACVFGICETQGPLLPGDTTRVKTQDGWSVRCLAWSGNRCVHPQLRMSCLVCGVYSLCGVWHDITSWNNNGTTQSFCAIGTGDETVLWNGAGGAAVAPRACGWGSNTHPLCQASKATYHPAQVSNLIQGLNLEDSYCGISSTLINIECGGW